MTVYAGEAGWNFLPTHSQYHSFHNIRLPLEASQVKTLYQDNEGLIWIGTSKGVFYYDGYEAHRLEITEGFSNDDITAFLQPDSTHLYIGTMQGLRLFNLDTERYEPLLPSLDSIQSITDMVFFKKQIWIGTTDGSIYNYDFLQKRLSEFAPEGKGQRRSIHVLEPSNDKLYVGAYNGLMAYDPSTGSTEHIALPVSKHETMITSLLWDAKENCIWIGTENSFCRYSKTDKHISTFPLSVATPIESLQKDSRGNLLLGTINGLYVYDMKDKQAQLFVHSSRNSHSLPDNLITCCLIDRDGNTWLGTGNGLSLAPYTPAYQLIHISELTDNDTGNKFLSLYKDSRKNYWLGGKNGLILQSAEKENCFYQSCAPNYPLHHNKIWQIYEDRQSHIWIATDGGIAHYDAAEKQFVFYDITDQSGQKRARWAYDIKEDAKGRLWIASYFGGLFVVDKSRLLKHNPTVKYEAELNFSHNIYQLLADKNDTFWASSDDGLLKISTDTDLVTTMDIQVETMAYDGNEYLWYSNSNNLYRFNIGTQKEERMHTFPHVENRIYSLVMAENLIGLSYAEGIMYMDRNTLEEIHFNLPQNDYVPGFYDADLNCIVWGGNDMLAVFPLHTLYDNISDTPQPVQIMGIYAGNSKLFPGKDYKGKSVRRQSQITLPYAKRTLCVKIASLSCPAENYTVYYHLNSSDNWNKLPTVQRQITLANLSSGVHTLEIKNENSLQNSLAAYSRFTIRILPPWYLSWPALATYALALGILLFIAARTIRLRLKRKHEEAEKYLNLSNMKLDFFMYISRELVTSLNLIITPVTALMEDTHKEEQKHRLKQIHNNAIRLHTQIRKLLDIKQLDYEDENSLNKSRTELCALVQSVFDCYRSTFEEKEIQATLFCQPSRIWIQADSLKIELALFGLLNDICQNARGQGGGRLEFTLTLQGEQPILQLSDNGTNLFSSRYVLALSQLFANHTNKVLHYQYARLYAVKKCLSQHGGGISMQGGGKSICIHITFPAEEDGAIILPVKEKVTAPAEEEKPLLLIICNHPEELALLTEMLAASYNCLTACSGKEGQEIARQQLPSLIIADINIGDKEGKDFCRGLRNYQPTAHIPLVILASETGQEAEKESIRVGANVFMPKPIDIEGLCLHLDQLLQMRCSLEKKMRIEHIAQPAEEPVPTQNGNEIFLQRITKLIEEQLENTEFNVSMLAEMSHTDKKQLNRRLKQIIGFTPVEYIRQIRLKKAAMLLARKDLSVSEVMYRTGFSNASYFSRCFVTEFGMTPTQYMTESH